MARDLLISLCTYNERENLQRLLPEIRAVAPDAHVLIVDDNSPDGTGDFARQQAEADPVIHVIRREGKLGLGTATVAAMRFAIENDYRWLLNMDADFSHDPKFIPALTSARERADVVIGSRYVPGGRIEGWPWWRHLMSRGINWYARTLLRLPVRDCSGAFRCYRTAVLARIDLSRIRARGYAFQEEILKRCRDVGARFVEVPIVFRDRRFGQSKIDWKESVTALWVILRLALERSAEAPVPHQRTP
ncbi:MAG: polyprenol monophosphomannose synthase [Planctomycetota bacterium]|nr:MAG: polyprenol monophosphomannose synthase [Planctomycetota bacterium]